MIFSRDLSSGLHHPRIRKGVFPMFVRMGIPAGGSRRFRFLIVASLLLSSALTGQGLKTGYIDIEGRKMYYEEKGEGRALLLIHGFSLDSRMWDDQFDTFAMQYRVIRYDMSGYGRSSVPDTPISSSTEIATLLRKLGVDKATIVGMSLGGWAAVRFAVDYPQMTKGVITVGASLDGYRFNEPLRGRLESYPRLAKDSGLARAKEVWQGDRLLTPVNKSRSVKAKIRQIISEWSGIQFSKPNLWGFKKSVPPAIRRLSEIKVPALAIVGERDEPDMHNVADTLASLIPGGRKVVVSGCGHLLNFERPDEFNRIVLDFLSRNGKRE